VRNLPALAAAGLGVHAYLIAQKLFGIPAGLRSLGGDPKEEK
jgi:hypothetical protein